MGSLAVSVRTAWLTALTGGAAYSNAAVWVQLHLGDPGAAGIANLAVNAQRQQAAFGTAAAGSVSNNALVAWTGVPATETYTHVSLWSSASGGTLIGTDDLATPIPATLGGAAAIPVGGILVAVV